MPKTIKKYTIGNKEYTFSQLCKEYPQLSPMTMWRRIKDSGMSAEEAVETPVLGFHQINVSERTDHKGIVYKTKGNMLKAYNVASNSFDWRISQGWSLEEALTGIHFNYYDPNGKGYVYRKDMLKAWGISADYYRTWSKRGYSDEDILLKRVDSNWKTLKSRTDHKGIVYKSVDDMCNAYNVTKSTYQDRKKRGWSLQECLEGKKGVGNIKAHVFTKEELTDPYGNVYESVNKMCKSYKVSNVRYIARLKDGYSQLEALNIIPLLKENTKDVLLVNKIRLEGFVYKKKKELYFACAFNNGTEEILSKSEILKLVI